MPSSEALDKLKNDFKKKRKFNFASEDEGERARNKKKILHSDLREEVSNSMKIKNASNNRKIISKPKVSSFPPSIFQEKSQSNISEDFSDSVLLNIVSSKCLDSDKKNRFSYSLGSCDSKSTNEESEKYNLEKEKSGNDLIEENSEHKKHSSAKSKKMEDTELSESSDSEFSSSLSTEKEICKNFVKTYKTCVRGKVIFHMPHFCFFSFHGEIKITVISGEVEILGFILNKASSINNVNIYSPNFCLALTVKTNVPKDITDTNKVKNDLKNLLTQDDIQKLFSNFKPNDSILLVEQIVSDFGLTLHNYFEKSLFPKDLENVHSFSQSLQELQCLFYFKPSKNSKAFRKNTEWDNVPLLQRTVLCGGKGVGKSTLLKYYSNKLLPEDKKILCLDFDPGQPEFTPPGFVSAVIIEEPLLGPNFTHVTDPKVMVYYGSVDVCQNPTRYIECVDYIIQQCNKDEELGKMKWIINTMGFCKGLGVHLMVTILKMIKPNTVIQIKSFDRKNNYPYHLTPDAINSQKAFKSLVPETNLDFDLRLIRSCAQKSKKRLESGLKPRELRDIMTVAYFSKLMGPPYYSLNAVEPYVVSFSDLYLAIDSSISPHEILKVFNANIVSLCHFSSGCLEILTIECNPDIKLKIVVKPDVNSSFGLGFVRGIDCDNSRFYILTHLNPEELEKVNCLTLGRLSPPHSLFLKQETVEGLAPYTEVSTGQATQRVKRMFRVPAVQQMK